jgi:glycosyltransferase involved in cell wall biosynthesis
MRILYLDEVSEIGGGGHSLNYLMRYLDPARFTPMLMGPSGPILDLAERSGISTHEYTFCKRYLSIGVGRHEIPVNPYRLIYRLRDALNIKRIVDIERIDMVHTNNLDAHLTGWFLNKIFGIPAVWHIRSIWHPLFYKIPWPSKIVFVSRALKEMALGVRNSNPSAHVIYNGIDSADFEAPPGSRETVMEEFGLPNRPIVGIVGRLTPWKRHDLFLRAAKILTQQGVDASWIIVGSEIENRTGTDHTRYLKNLCRVLEVEDRVIFTGLRNDIPKLVGSFDVFVSTSDNDPNPRVVLEAMVMGKAVIGTNSGGVPEMIEDRKTGLLVEQGNAEAIASAIFGLLREPRFAKELGCAAKERVESDFSIRNHVKQIEHIYAEIANKN